MFAQAAQRMGYRALVVAATDDEPAAQVADEVLIGLTDDLKVLQGLCRRADALTVEFENVSSPALRWLGQRLPTRPGWKTVRVSQNRLREKQFLRRAGVPTAPWAPVRTEVELDRACTELGLPLILKTASSGYDGKGQIRVETRAEAETAWLALNRVACVAEGLVRFAAELSVLVARASTGRLAVYPPALNSHSRHILDTTMMPAPVGPVVTAEAQRLAAQVATALETVGVLCVEMFLSSEGELRVNEIAPRPHNSGHLTIEAAVTSQFEQQVRVLAGLPLGSSDLVSPAAMANLLGDLWGGGEPDWSALMESEPCAKLHLYGKRRAVVGRKMGHLTILDPKPENAIIRARAARARTQVRAGADQA
jgi:5-(carboxyamino)imidazole ribonucleotide synthase